MPALNATALRLGTTALTRVYYGSNLVWSGGGPGPDPEPGPENPIFPDYSPVDPHWEHVAFFADYGRGVADQSERGYGLGLVANEAPAISPSGVTLDGIVNGLIYEGDASLDVGGQDFTVELFGCRLTADVPCVLIEHVGAGSTARSWSIRRVAGGWSILLSTNGSGWATLSVPDATDPTAAPLDLCLERAGNAIRFYRGGEMIFSSSYADNIFASGADLRIGHARAGGTPGGTSFAPMVVRAARLTVGVARYASDAGYVSALPALDRAVSQFGAYRIGWGAWTWYNDPRALAVAGKLIVGATTIWAEVFELDPANQHLRHIRPGIHNQQDDHNNPGIIRRADGRIVTLATGHNTPYFYTGISTSADDVISTAAFRDAAAEIGLDSYSYSNPVQLEGEAGAPLYQIGRNAGPWMLYMSKSLDGGATWQPYQQLFSGSGRPYVKVVKTSATRLDMLVTDGHPDATTNNSVYHGYFEGGAWHQSDGTPVGAMPFLPSALTKIHDGTAARCWNAEIGKIGGQIGVLYMTYPTTEDHRYWRGVWTGTAWQTEQICAAGGPLYGGQPYYSGGLTFAPDSLDVVYASRQDGAGIHQIHRCTRVGGVWGLEQMTDGARPSFRPFTVSSPDTLFWCNGRYTTYLNYRASICMVPLPLVVAP